jgi:hypothetical protein
MKPNPTGADSFGAFKGEVQFWLEYGVWFCCRQQLGISKYRLEFRCQNLYEDDILVVCWRIPRVRGEAERRRNRGDDGDSVVSERRPAKCRRFLS